MDGAAGPGGHAAAAANGRAPGTDVHLTEAMAAIHGAAHLAQYTRDPFLRFFEDRSVDDLIPAGTLLDHPNVRRWFELFSAGLPESLYTYQLPLTVASGPDSAALGQPLIMFSSYSYLGLIGHPRIATAVKEAVERYGTSTGGVRLLTGTLELHHELEYELARFLGQEGAATFASGYDANIAAITSLFGPNDVAILDQYAHQSIHDGARMAGCENRRFRHNDLDDLERRLRQARNRGAQRILVAVDSVFSMDGDQAPIADLITLKTQVRRVPARRRSPRPRRRRPHRPWHLRGAEHRSGRHRHPHRLALQGNPVLRRIRRRLARPQDLHPARLGSVHVLRRDDAGQRRRIALEALRIVQDEPEHMERLRRNTRIMKDGLTELGFSTGASTTPVLPLLLGDEFRAYRVARAMLERGIFVSAVVYPAVSPGQARLDALSSAPPPPTSPPTSSACSTRSIWSTPCHDRLIHDQHQR
jgi:7-keto-8-aminopelargonate synthetase-like enzyme